jgi:hypothetical protein
VERLRDHLARVTGVHLSISRLRTLLRQQDYVYRRPKHDLTNLQDAETKATAQAQLEGPGHMKGYTFGKKFFARRLQETEPDHKFEAQRELSEQRPLWPAAGIGRTLSHLEPLLIIQFKEFQLWGGKRRLIEVWLPDRGE